MSTTVGPGPGDSHEEEHDPEGAREQVLAAAAACVQAFGDHDTTAYFACFHPSATFLFHSTDRVLGSREEYQAEWAAWQSEGFRVMSCRSSEQRVDVRGTTAVLTHRVRTEVRPAVGAAVEVLHERETIVFCRQADGRWLGVHEHLSVDPGSRRTPVGA